MAQIYKIASVLLLTFFLGTMFFSLFHMSMGMDMSGGMTDCPFMSHGEMMCPMNLADHLGTWKSVFMTIAPSLSLLLVTAVLLGISVAPNVLRNFKYLHQHWHRRFKIRVHTFSYRPLQELFSDGILHPKLH